VLSIRLRLPDDRRTSRILVRAEPVLLVFPTVSGPSDVWPKEGVGILCFKGVQKISQGVEELYVVTFIQIIDGG